MTDLTHMSNVEPTLAQRYLSMMANVLKFSKIEVNRGESLFIIWKNHEHLKEWEDHKVSESKDLRICRVSSQQVPSLNLGNADRKEVCVVGIAYAQKPDLSDICCVFHAVFTKQPLPPNANAANANTANQSALPPTET